MATYTSNLHLKKPDRTENYAIADANGNMDILDAQFGKFELIEEITLEESVSLIERTQTPQGKNYNFDKLILLITLPVSNLTYRLKTVVNNLQGNTQGNFKYSAAAILKDFEFYDYSNIVKQGLIIFGTSTGNPQGAYGLPFPQYEKLDNVKITNVNISGFSTTDLVLAGTKIKIYGIWA